MSLHRIVIKCKKYNLIPEYESFYFDKNKNCLEIINELNELKCIEKNIKINRKLLKNDEDFFVFFRALYNINDSEKVNLSKEEIDIKLKKDNYYA
tara:strand:+ start:3331 stop:3615 length:285 start_codon:yes stop_codon:yes gene_type:complete